MSDPTTISLISYNTHLFVGTPPAVFKSCDDELRRNAICDALIKLGSQGYADVVALCEVWADETFSYMANAIENPFRHSYRPISGGAFETSSGLALFSKYPIIKPSFTSFQDSKGWDSASDKGFIMATIANQAGTPMFKLITTHTQASYGDDLSPYEQVRANQLKQIMRAMHGAPSGTKWVLTGDLNIIGESNGYKTSEYRQCKAVMENVGLVDLFANLYPPTPLNKGQNCTLQGVNNPLISYFDGPDANAWMERLDYFFVSNALASSGADAKLLNRQFVYSPSDSDKFPAACPTSDHYAIYAKVVVS